MEVGQGLGSLIVQAKTDSGLVPVVIGRVRRLIYRWARRHCVRPDMDVDDVALEGLVLVPGVIRSWDGRLPFIPYLRICCLRAWKRKFPRDGVRMVPLGNHYDEIVDEEYRQRLAEEYTAAQVGEILEKMDPTLASSIRMAYGIGTSRTTVRESAKVAGTSETNQHRRLRKAIATFRRAWEGTEEAEPPTTRG